MRCAERRADGGPCRRAAVAAVSAGALVTLLCGEHTVRAARLLPALAVRWLDERAARAGRAC